MTQVEIATDLPPALIPVAWLVGTWEGFGVGNRGGAEYRFRQRVGFAHDGRPFLAYESAVWELDASGEQSTPDARETGFWRMAEGISLEVVVASASGTVEIYLGSAEGGRIELATDVVGRTATAPAYTAGRRLYGSVEGDLLYAHDAAFEGAEAGLVPLRSARLRQVQS